MKRRQLFQAAILAAPAFIPGLSMANQTKRVGLSLPLTGVQAEVANDLLAGYQLAFQAGKAAGTDLKVMVEDDGSKPENTARNVSLFAKDSAVIAISGIVGTPHARAALPMATTVPVVGIRSGAQELRTNEPNVFHLRASYEDEIDRMMRVILDSGFKRVAVVYSDDAFGKGVITHARKAAQGLGVTITAAEAAERNGSDVEQKVDAVLRDPNAALMVLMIANPMLRAVHHARVKRSFIGPVYVMSFTGTREVSTLKDQWARGLGMVSAFPLPRVAPMDVARRYREVATAAGREDLINSLTAFEGWFYGSAVVRAAERAPKLTREGLAAALRAPRPINLGGVEIAFDQHNVGYRHLQLVYKSHDGLLRS